MVVPYLFPGWLSGKWVNGIGRSIKLSRMYMEIAAFPSEPPGVPPEDSGYEQPFATVDIWLEWWLPAGYFGGRNVDLQPFELFVGHLGAHSTLNVLDMPRAPGEPSVANRFAAPLPRVPDGDSPEAYSFWANQLLRNNQGIDFAGNPGVIAGNTNIAFLRQDHSQILAQKFHDPFARFDRTNATGPWRGDGRAPDFLPSGRFRDYASPLFMTSIDTNTSPTNEWQPGQMRVIRSRLGAVGTTNNDYRYSMHTNAITNSVLEIRGGIAVKTQVKSGFLSDPDPVPLEAIRGPWDVDGLSVEEPYTGMQGRNKSELQINNEWETGNPSGLRQRVLDSVIPVKADVAVASATQVVAAAVEDPLVNKFPGDWKLSAVSTISPTENEYKEDQSIVGATFRSRLADPDSYWMPQADAGLSQSIGEVADQTEIPRSARMPSIGYLQYIRTGIIPDDETLPYPFDPAQPNREIQHGTPFRLLSFAPSTEPSSSNPLIGQRTTYSGSESYPDWALLDLLYIPSTLAPYGSVYNPAVANPSHEQCRNETPLLRHVCRSDGRKN